MQINRRLAWSTLAARACVVALAGWGQLALALEPDVSDSAPGRFASEIAAFESWDRKNAVPREAILFVGSSSIRLWPTAESFPNLPVINRGFGGSQISDVNRYAKRIVLRYEPRVIVFYAGDNDIAAGESPKQVAEDFQSFVDLVQAELPDTRIIYLPIKPSIARWKLWPEMREANALVERLAKSSTGVEYVDTATPMLADDGRPRQELFLEDGLHLNDRGYELWTEILKPVLQNTQE